MHRRKQIVLVAIATLMSIAIAHAGATPPQAPKPAPSQHKPIIEVDLHKFGFQDINRNSYLQAGGTFRVGIDFTDGDSLIWAWLTRDSVPPHFERGTPSPPQPSHLHAVLLDTTTGQEKAKQDWPVPSFTVQYRAIETGKFFTCIENKMRLTSADFELLQEKEAQPPKKCSSLAVSPSGQTILVSYYSEGEHQFEILDTVKLNTISMPTEDKSVAITSISDHWLAGLCGKPQQLCIRPTEGDWQAFPLATAKTQKLGPTRGRIYFLTDETVLIGERSEMTVAKLDGSVLFQVKLPKNRSNPSYDWRLLQTSNDRFAVMEDREVGIESSFLDLGKFPSHDEIVVFSTSERRAIFALKVKGSSPWPPFIDHKTEYALSPDGKLLAVVVDGILRTYKLPNGQAAR